jgi:hypothetical protein
MHVHGSYGAHRRLSKRGTSMLATYIAHMHTSWHGQDELPATRGWPRLVTLTMIMA